MFLCVLVRLIGMCVDRCQTSSAPLQYTAMDVIRLPIFSVSHFRGLTCRSSRTFVHGALRRGICRCVVICVVGRTFCISLRGPFYAVGLLLSVDWYDVTTSVKARAVQNMFGVSLMCNFRCRSCCFLCRLIVRDQRTGESFLAIFLQCMRPL